MSEKILVDGVTYVPYHYMEESELEYFVIKHSGKIFGKNNFYLPKSKLKSKGGLVSIPDGFVIDFNNRKWYVVEIELAEHDVYNHIVPQMSKFINGIKNPDNRKELIGKFYEWFCSEPIEKAKSEILLGGMELYKTINDIIEKPPQFLVIIDKRTDQVAEAVSSIAGDTRIIEFKTFIREDIGDIRVHLHLFEPPIVPLKAVNTRASKYQETENKVKAGKYQRAKRGTITPQKEYYLPILEALVELGGKGRVSEVLGIVFNKMKNELTSDDLKEVPSGKDIRWENAAKWARWWLVNNGYLSNKSPYGIWEITTAGQKYLEKLKGE